MSSVEVHQILPGGAETDRLIGMHTALEQLVEACVDRLNVGLAAILMRDERIKVHCNNDVRPVRDAGALVAELDEDLDRWLKAARAAAQRNNRTTAKRRLANPTIPCKIALAPISLTKRTVDGVFVLANPPNCREFTAKAKDMLRVACRDASEIILAHRDIRTGLMNRKELEYLVDQALRSPAISTTRHCVLHLDLDEVQKLEDLLSREARDAAIGEVARQLDRGSYETGPVGRIGEDKFVILLEDCPLHRGIGIAQEVRRAIGALNIIWNDQTVKVTTSIGVTQLIPGIGTPDSVLAAAKIACATAKDRGRNQVAAFRHQDAARLADRRRIEVVSHIQKALENDSFVLYGQPIRSLSARTRARHFEILIRSTDDDGCLVLPDQFMPHAEHSQIMPEIDRWVVRHTLELLSEGCVFRKHRKIVFAMNLSGQSICEDGFLDFVLTELKRMDVPPSSICFEVTETAAILNMVRAKEFMSALRKHGCLFSLDDFGAGLSSFSYLKTLPINYLKIDGQFVKEIVDDPVCEAIVAAINQMSHAMGARTIAESVQSREIKKRLAHIGIDYVQGDSIAKPKALFDVLRMLE